MTRALTLTEIKDISAAFKRERDRFLFTLGTMTGFRISELVSLTWGQLVSKDNKAKTVLRMERAMMKGKKRPRLVKLGSSIQEKIMNYARSERGQAGDNDRIFKFTRRRALQILREAYINAGINGTDVPRLTGSHCMRKTFANMVYNNSGKDIITTQQLMGHRSLSSTQSYIARNEELETKTLDKVQDALGDLY